jgi:hypothetical protein
MHKLIAQFPANITDAFQIASEMKYQKPANAIHNIVAVSYTHLTLPTT